VNNTIEVTDLASFCTAFGSLGSMIGPRTGAGKRTQDDLEWFVVRHFLQAGLRARIFDAPVLVQKRNPPEPDFRFELGGGGSRTIALVEITEATHPADQREMTEFERSSKPAMLLGDFGGRFSRGASQPGKAWVSDVLDAIKRKSRKSICMKSVANRHLVIYPNSNASILLSNEHDERAAFGQLNEIVEMSNRCSYVQMANGCLVHVLGKEYVCFDILGSSKLVRREATKVRAGV
jgi:hypothetical protein